jgi:flagellar biosynthesis/type III secretory pathway protein FliH
MIDLNDDIKERLRISNELYRKGYKVGLEEGFSQGLSEGLRKAREIVEKAFADMPEKQA